MSVYVEASENFDLVSHDRLENELRRSSVGVRHARRDQLCRTVGGAASQALAGAERTGLREHRAQVIESVDRGIDGVAIVNG